MRGAAAQTCSLPGGPAANIGNHLRLAEAAASEAVQLLVNGFVKDVLQELPMEFAVEAQKLVAISLEGSVG